MLFSMIAFPLLPLRAILRRPLPCLLAIHFTPSCQNATVVSGCHQTSFTLPSHIKNMPPHGKHATLTLSAVFFCSMIFTLYSDFQGYYTVSCVTVQQKLLKHEDTQLAGPLLRQDFYAHSPILNIDNRGISGKPHKAIIINQPFSSVFKG